MSTSVATPSRMLPPAQGWRALYQAALFETDRKQAAARITMAEQAVLTRMRELFGATEDHIEEDLILDDALYALRALRHCLSADSVVA